MEIFLDVLVPITEWSGSGTLSVMQDETLTEWRSYTPGDPSNVAVSAKPGHWRRVGSDIEIAIRLTFNGTPSSGVRYSMTNLLPTGLSLDTGSWAGGSGTIACGVYNFIDASAASTANEFPGIVSVNPGTPEIVFSTGNAADEVDASAPVVGASGDTLSFTLKLPILEWRGKSNGAVGFGLATDTAAGLITKQKIGSVTTTFTMNGSGGTTSSVVIKLQRLGDWVTAYIPAFSATSGTSSDHFDSDTDLPSWATPAVEQRIFNGEATNNNATATGVSQWWIQTNGNIAFYRADRANFTNSTVAGLRAATTISWYVGT